MSAATGTAADAFLGTQGDVWDTQKDMLMCMIGSLTALIVFSRRQDRWIEKLDPARQAAHVP
jgi:putative membrane protein